MITPLESVADCTSPPLTKSPFFVASENAAVCTSSPVTFKFAETHADKDSKPASNITFILSMVTFANRCAESRTITSASNSTLAVSGGPRKFRQCLVKAGGDFANIVEGTFQIAGDGLPGCTRHLRCVACLGRGCRRFRRRCWRYRRTAAQRPVAWFAPCFGAGLVRLHNTGAGGAGDENHSSSLRPRNASTRSIASPFG